MNNDDLVHRLRSLTLELDVFGSAFAARNELHATDLRALVALLDRQRSGDVASPGWLAGHLGLNSASTTALIDRLETKGLVSRLRDGTDRRKVALHVTDAAQQMGWAFFGPLIEQVIAVADGFSDDELAAIRTFLDRVTTAVADARSR